jgi:hypothetical protein
MQEEFQIGEELLQEEIKDAELRQLLDRLGQQEFGGSGLSRVADVVEATGATPRAVAEALADIRKEDWERKFGARQALVEKRQDDQGMVINHHAQVLADHERRLTGKTPRDFDARAEAQRYTERMDRMRSPYTPFILGAAMIIAIYLFIVMATPPKTPADIPPLPPKSAR